METLDDMAYATVLPGKERGSYYLGCSRCGLPVAMGDKGVLECDKCGIIEDCDPALTLPDLP
jgi:hypothetical protein